MKLRQPSFTTNFADLAVVIIITVLFLSGPYSPYRPKPATLGDKVEIRYYKTLAPDSLEQAIDYVEEEIREMDYYLRIHTVDDEGYNLVADYNAGLRNEYHRLLLQRDSAVSRPATVVRIAAKDRPKIAVLTHGVYWQGLRFVFGPFMNGKAVALDQQGGIVRGEWKNGRIVNGIRKDRLGIYRGEMDSVFMPHGQGVMDEWDGCHKEGFWQHGLQHGFGFDSSPQHQLRIGEWRDGKFLGERIKYTALRIYGIDVSRHQHEKGRRRYPIHWNRVRITSFGRNHDIEGQTFPVSFVYIKSTQGTTIRNRYYPSDSQQARRQGIKVGAYHFFSLKASAQAQAHHFLRLTTIRPGDLAPVLDVEPSEGEIRRIGEAELLRRVRQWMEIVEQRTGCRPILYVNQGFINRHLKNAKDIKKKYKVWIARYGEYKPDVKLAYWQLCSDGRVDGIQGPVDINVFNGFAAHFRQMAE